MNRYTISQPLYRTMVNLLSVVEEAENVNLLSVDEEAENGNYFKTKHKLGLSAISQQMDLSRIGISIHIWIHLEQYFDKASYHCLNTYLLYNIHSSEHRTK